MNKNSKYIYTEKIIDPFGTAKPAQVGVDLTIAKIEVIEGSAIFDTDSKLDKNSIRYTEADSYTEGDQKYYILKPNTNYAIEFEQGLKQLNDNEWGFIVQRSSLLRTGCHIISSIWDPGFQTSQMGTTLLTGNIPVCIPVGCRVAQLLIFDNEPTELYCGTWQGVANHV